MKKLFIILVAVIGFAFSANAASCRVDGSAEGAQVFGSIFFDGTNTVVQITTNSSSTVQGTYSVSGSCMQYCSGHFTIIAGGTITHIIAKGRDVSSSATVHLASARCAK